MWNVPKPGGAQIVAERSHAPGVHKYGPNTTFCSGIAAEMSQARGVPSTDRLRFLLTTARQQDDPEVLRACWLTMVRLGTKGAESFRVFSIASTGTGRVATLAKAQCTR